MAFSCLTHVFTTTVSTPDPTHGGAIHRAPLPQNHPSTFTRASNMPATASAPSLVTSTAYREHLASIDRPRAKTTNVEEEILDSWVPDSEFKDKNGWHTGYERATQTTVKRKGRGAFMFEGAGMEEWEVDIKEEDGDEDEEGRFGVGGLEHGFEYRGWVDGEMAIVRAEGMEGEVVGCESVCVDGEESGIGIERRNAMDGNRDSVARAIFWDKL